MRIWTLTIMAPCEWICANRDTAHQWQSRSRLVRKWRQAVVDCCRAGDLPCGDNRLALIDVSAIARFRGKPPVHDSGNLRPTLKAVVDGLCPPRRYGRSKRPAPGYGLIPDDRDKYVANDTIRLGERLPNTVIADHPGLLIVTIRELKPANTLF